MYIDADELESIIEKANIYIREEKLLVSDFKRVFSDLSYSYITSNTSKVDSLFLDINLALEKIAINSNNNTMIFDKTIQKYEDLSRQSKENFETLETEANVIFKSDL